MKSNQPLNYGTCPQCNNPIAVPGISHSYCAQCQDWQLTLDRPKNLATQTLPTAPSKPKKSAPGGQPQQIDLLGGAA